MNDIILSAIPFPLVVINVSATVVYANEAACNELGVAIGRDIFDFLDAEARILMRNALVSSVCDANLFRAGKNGKHYRLQTNGLDNSALLCCFIPGTPMDGHQLNLSKELDESRTTLNKFIYSVSHDLQEPVRIVNSYVRLIKSKLKDLDDSELGEYLFFAEDASSRLQSMMSDLISYSRITTQASPFKSVAASQILEKVLYGMSERIKDSGISIDIGSMPVLFCDERQMLIVFEAIIDNAIKFRSAENPSMHISSRMVDDMNQLVFEDNGIGIERKMQDRVFDVFQRLHPRNKFSGNGMGLTLCRKIMERHGGRIELESDSGKGLRVILSFDK